MRRSQWILLSTVCGLGLATAPAVAQQAPASAEASDESAIIVTARRQNERLQDVPASVAVLTSDTL